MTGFLVIAALATPSFACGLNKAKAGAEQSVES